MITRTRTRVPVVIAVLLASSLIGVACGGEDEAAERTAEKLIEASAEGGDVDVDIDGDEVTIEGADGGATFATGDELPKGWPDDIAMPDGATLAGGSSMQSDAGINLTSSGKVGLDVADVAAHFEGEFDDWKTDATNDVGSGDQSLSTRAWSRGDDVASLTATPGDGGGTTFVVTIATKPA